MFGRFKTPPERMPGIRLAQVFDPPTEQLYTLYTNRAAEYTQGSWADASYGEREVSFVHVLNLRKGWAYCAGLPRALWGQPARAQALAPDRLAHRTSGHRDRRLAPRRSGNGPTRRC